MIKKLTILSLMSLIISLTVGVLAPADTWAAHPQLTGSITRTQNRQSVIATLSDGQTAQWHVSLYSDRPSDCSDPLKTKYNEELAKDANSVTKRFWSVYAYQVICFRATNPHDPDNILYSRPYHIDLAPPVIDLSTTNNILTISSKTHDKDDSSWQRASLNTADERCNPYTQNLVAIEAGDLNFDLVKAAPTPDEFYCYSIADRLENRSYQLVTVTYVFLAPLKNEQITLNQTPSNITASLSNDYEAKWATTGFLTTDPSTCDSTQIYTELGGDDKRNTATKSLTSSSHDKWICFIAYNTTLEEADSLYSTLHKVDTTGPIISTATNNHTLTVSSSTTDKDNASWKRTASSNTSLTCDSSQTYTATNTLSFNLRSNRTRTEYYCYLVADKIGNQSFKLITVNYLTTVKPKPKPKPKPELPTETKTETDNISTTIEPEVVEPQPEPAQTINTSQPILIEKSVVKPQPKPAPIPEPAQSNLEQSENNKEVVNENTNPENNNEQTEAQIQTGNQQLASSSNVNNSNEANSGISGVVVLLLFMGAITGMTIFVVRRNKKSKHNQA